MWETVSAEFDGAPLVGVGRAISLTFTGDQCAAKFRGNTVESASIKLKGLFGKVVKFDLLITSGANVGETAIGIYQRNGNELKWCVGLKNKVKMRPTAFATKRNDGFVFRLFKRQKE